MLGVHRHAHRGTQLQAQRFHTQWPLQGLQHAPGDVAGVQLVAFSELRELVPALARCQRRATDAGSQAPGHLHQHGVAHVQAVAVVGGAKAVQVYVKQGQMAIAGVAGLGGAVQRGFQFLARDQPD